MTIQQITTVLDNWAPPAYQESYDNCGLLTGQQCWHCTGVLCTLDATEAVVQEAIDRQCNLIVAHHPILFSGLKKLSGNSYVERAIIKAIKNDIAIYAIHTNLDHVAHGVNHMMAGIMGIKPESLAVLQPKTGLLCKLMAFVPQPNAPQVLQALYTAGAGQIGQYENCSFSTEGIGTFKPLPGSHPFIGTAGGQMEQVAETKIEVIFPQHLQTAITRALLQAHPYETPAFDIVVLQNTHPQVGSGMIGELSTTLSETEWLHRLKTQFGLQVIRHTALLNRPVRTVAFCGGSGAFLTRAAIAASADAYVTADIKYHDFFEADGRLLLVDIGHFESEKATIAGISKFLQAKFPTFAVLQTEVNTNPVHYFI